MRTGASIYNSYMYQFLSEVRPVIHLATAHQYAEADALSLW